MHYFKCVYVCVCVQSVDEAQTLTKRNGRLSKPVTFNHLRVLAVCLTLFYHTGTKMASPLSKLVLHLCMHDVTA